MPSSRASRADAPPSSRRTIRPLDSRPCSAAQRENARSSPTVCARCPTWTSQPELGRDTSTPRRASAASAVRTRARVVAYSSASACSLGSFCSGRYTPSAIRRSMSAAIAAGS